MLRDMFYGSRGLFIRISFVYLQRYKLVERVFYIIFKRENLIEFYIFYWNVNGMLVKMEMLSGILIF